MQARATRGRGRRHRSRARRARLPARRLAVASPVQPSVLPARRRTNWLTSCALAARVCSPATSAVATASSRRLSACAKSPSWSRASPRSGKSSRRRGRGGQQGGRTEEQLRRGVHVAAHEGAPPGRSEPPRSLGRQLERVLVCGRELHEVAVGLLQVVARDLLELRRTVAVDPVAPLYEALVEGRPCPLEKPLVHAFADEDVVEAMQLRRLRLDELLARELLEPPADLRANEVLHELLERFALEVDADNRGRIDHRPLLALEAVEPCSHERVDRRRDPAPRAVRRCARLRPPSRSRPPSIIIESSCSTKSGFPSAASTMRARASSAMSASPRRLPITSALCLSRERRQGEMIEFRPCRPQLEHVGPGNAEEQCRAPSAVVATWSRRSRSAGSAQCRSSKTRTSGRRADKSSTSLRTAQKTSGSAYCRSESPTADASRSKTSS